MASANPKVDDSTELDAYIDNNDLEKILVFDPHELQDFDEWYIAHSLEQLMDVHSSLKLRWDIMHWVFTIPLVSRDYIDTELRQVLETVVSQLKAAVEIGRMAHDPTTCFSLKIPSLDLIEVVFNVTEDYLVIPHSYSFEAVCIRLQLDPEVMRSNVKYMMRKNGIEHLIECMESAVRAKCAPPRFLQYQMVDGVNLADIKTFLTPISVPGLVVRPSNSKALRLDLETVIEDLFPQGHTI